ncbi:MAG: serine hydrolase [Clostridia bacterium]|nr:serine hydrolase [Clostridia bacterium]
MNFKPMEEFLDHLTGWRIPGNVMVVYKDGEAVFEYTSGYSDVEKGEKMSFDKFFYIYSCSKITTTLCALQLWEKGLYKLDDPLYDFIPEYKDMYVKRGKDDVIKSPVPITIRNLFTMTAGFDYNFNVPGIQKVGKETNGRFDTLKTIKGLAEEPLFFVPGERWNYSLCHDVLGGFIEAVSGKTLAEYARENVFGPLGIDAEYGMTDFYRQNMAQMYRFVDERGESDIVKLQKSGISMVGGHIEVNGTENNHILGEGFYSGGAGIVTNVPDYAKLMAAIANGGKDKKGERIINRETIDLWRTNQLNEVQMKDFNWPQLKGYGYGLGVRTMIDPSIGTPLGEIGWGGAAGANALIDVDNNISFFYAHHMLNNQESYVQPRLRDVLYKCMK